MRLQEQATVGHVDKQQKFTRLEFGRMRTTVLRKEFKGKLEKRLALLFSGAGNPSPVASSSHVVTSPERKLPR